MSINLYEILEVDSKATFEEIKKSYRKLANQHHPDKGGDGEHFKKLAEAYTILSDDDKRKRYDSGESVDTIRNPQMDLEFKAISAVLSVFIEVVKNQPTDHMDIVEKMNFIFKDAEKRFKAEIAKCEGVIKKFEKVIERIKRKDGSDHENIFTRSADSQIQNLRLQIEKLQSELEVAGKAQEILEKYQYNLEDLPQLQTFGGFTFTVGGL